MLDLFRAPALFLTVIMRRNRRAGIHQMGDADPRRPPRSTGLRWIKAWFPRPY